MKGLEVAEILKSVVFNSSKKRLNSEYYLKKIVAFRNNQAGEKLGSLTSYIKRGMQPKYSLKGHIRALRSVNVREASITDDREVFVDYEFYKKNRRGNAIHGDVLLTSTGVGTLGRAGIILDNNKYFVDGHISIIRTEKIMNTVLFLFLNSSYGQMQINALYNGSSGQIEIYPDDICEILVPRFGEHFQKMTDGLVLTSKLLNGKSKVNYQNVEKVFLERLGLKTLASTSRSINIKSFKDSLLSSGRLDAEFYLPKYDELEHRLHKTKASVKLIEKLTFNKRGKQPAYIESETGIPVLNSKHIRENRVEFTDNRLGNLEKTNADLIIRKNDVLVNGTGVGTIGRSAAYLKEEQTLPDNHVTILRTKNIDPVFLAVQLNSIVGKMQVEKHSRGSSGQIELYPDDIEQFLIWDAPEAVQQEIRKMIEESEKLRQESSELLELAKQAVEIAIEQGEEQAITYINQNH